MYSPCSFQLSAADKPEKHSRATCELFFRYSSTAPEQRELPTKPSHSRVVFHRPRSTSARRASFWQAVGCAPFSPAGGFWEPLAKDWGEYTVDIEGFFGILIEFYNILIRIMHLHKMLRYPWPCMRIPHLVPIRFPPCNAHEKISSTCTKIPTILSTYFSKEKKWLRNLDPKNCEELYLR